MTGPKLFYKNHNDHTNKPRATMFTAKKHLFCHKNACKSLILKGLKTLDIIIISYKYNGARLSYTGNAEH